MAFLLVGCTTSTANSVSLIDSVTNNQENINNPLISNSPDTLLAGFQTQILSKHIDETNGQPFEICSLFNWSDNKVENRVYSSLEFDPLKSRSNFEWLWYDPTGSLWTTTQNIRDIGDTCAYSYFKVRNKKVGEWTVEVKVDGKMIDRKKFTINNSNPSQTIDCLTNTICGDQCCMGGYKCCHTKDGDRCYNPSTHYCTY